MIAAQTIRFILVSLYPLVTSGVQKCYIGALEVYENPRCSFEGIYYKVTHYSDCPRTLTMLDLMEVNTYKMMDCNVAHHDKEIVQ